MKTIKSNSKVVLSYMLSITLLLAMISCDSSERRNTDAELSEAERKVENAGEKVEEGLERGGEKIQKAAKDIGGDLEESKDKFVVATRKEMKELDVRIEKLKDRINAGTRSTSKETREEGREARAERTRIQKKRSGRAAGET
jgi:polyhydroxyalkanoate synthesis regulator phasin